MTCILNQVICPIESPKPDGFGDLEVEITQGHTFTMFFTEVSEEGFFTM